jgi:hypothetical protein
MERFKYEEEPRPAISWPFVAAFYIVGGALSGILFVGLFVRDPHWRLALSAVAFGYAGGYLGAKLYKRFHCGPETR